MGGVPAEEKHILSFWTFNWCHTLCWYSLQPTSIPWTSTQTYEIFKPLLLGFPFFQKGGLVSIYFEVLHLKWDFDKVVYCKQLYFLMFVPGAMLENRINSLIFWLHDCTYVWWSWSFQWKSNSKKSSWHKPKFSSKHRVSYCQWKVVLMLDNV